MNCSKIFLVISIIFLLALGGTMAKQSLQAKSSKAKDYVGVDSWYGPGFDGNLMANGQKFDKNNPRHAAHRTFKLGTKLEITNLANNKKLIVVILDRGPFTKNKQGKYTREIDLSYAGARKLDFVDSGLANVKIRILRNKNLRL